MSLPFVSRQKIEEFGDQQINFHTIYQDLMLNNPHLLDYIYGIDSYAEQEGKEITSSIAINLSLTVYALLNRANGPTKAVECKVKNERSQDRM